MVAVGEDPQEQVGAGQRVLRARDDERGSPARVEIRADLRLRQPRVEAGVVPLEDGVAAEDALLLRLEVGTPLVRALVLSLADRGGAREQRDPLVDVGVLRLGALRVRLPVKALTDAAEVREEHERSIGSMQVRSINAHGLRLRALDLGEGTPVLLVHGVGGWAENWQEVLAPIAASGRRVIALDLPGFGESERPRRGARYFDPDEPFYARVVWAALDALGVGAAHLVGSSLGGAVVMMAALTAPARVRSLTLVAGGGIGLEVAPLLRLVALPGVGLLARLPRPLRWADDTLRSCFHDPARIPAHLYPEVRRWGDRSFPEFVRVLRAGVGLRGVRPDLRERWIERARGYAGDVLVVWGRQDAVLPVAHAAAVRALLPDAEVVLIDRCGHLPMAERPAEFLGALLPFLGRADAERADAARVDAAEGATG